MNSRIYLFLLSFFLFHTIDAQESKLTEKPASIPSPKSFTSIHTTNVNGKTITYQVTAEELYFKGEEGKPVASFWSTAYTLPNNKVAKTNTSTTRPVCFIFNGLSLILI